MTRVTACGDEIYIVNDRGRVEANSEDTALRVALWRALHVMSDAPLRVYVDQGRPEAGSSRGRMVEPSQSSMLKLTSATLDRRDAFLRMAREWRDSGQDRYALALESFDAHVARIRQFEDPTRTPEGCVPGTELWVEEYDEIVACVRLRSRLTPAFAHEGGNIGYDVRPSARGRGVGTWTLRNALPEARRWGLERVLLTVDADNQPSLRIIEKCGGILSSKGVSEQSSKPIRRYWIELAP